LGNHPSPAPERHLSGGHGSAPPAETTRTAHGKRLRREPITIAARVIHHARPLIVRLAPDRVDGPLSVAATLAGTVRSAAQARSTGGVRGGCRSIPEPDPVRADRGRRRHLVYGCGSRWPPARRVRRWRAARR